MQISPAIRVRRAWGRRDAGASRPDDASRRESVAKELHCEYRGPWKVAVMGAGTGRAKARAHARGGAFWRAEDAQRRSERVRERVRERSSRLLSSVDEKQSRRMKINGPTDHSANQLACVLRSRALKEGSIGEARRGGKGAKENTFQGGVARAGAREVRRFTHGRSGNWPSFRRFIARKTVTPLTRRRRFNLPAQWCSAWDREDSSPEALLRVVPRSKAGIIRDEGRGRD